MKRILTSFTIVLFSIALMAQSGQSGQSTQGVEYTQDDLIRLGKMSANSPGVRSFDNRYEGVRGNPMLFNDWQEGIIYFNKDDATSEKLPLTIDAEKHDLYIHVKNNSISKIPTTKVREVVIHPGKVRETKFKVLPKALLEGGASRKLKILEVIYEGKYTLLKDNTKVIIKADYQGAYSADRRYDEYKTIRTYWLTMDGESFEKVKLKKKSLAEAFKKYGKKIDKIAKKNKLKLKDEASVKALLTLLEEKD